MTDREKVLKGLQIERECVSRNCNRDCEKCDLVQDRDYLLSVYDGAIALLKEQEPRLITKDDFANADAFGKIPAWIEYHPKLQGAEPMWKIIGVDMLSSPFTKAWTAKPTNEQKEAVKLND